MKIKFILLFTLLSFTTFSQTEFAPIDAEWYFNHPNPGTNDYIVFESKKDSTIQGKNSRVIDVQLNGTKLVGQEYIYQNGDSIFYYNPNYNSFYLLYNFSAKAGDTILVHQGKFKPTKAFFSFQDSITDFKYKILSVDSIQMSGQWIKRQKVTSINNALWGFSIPDGKDYYILNKVGSEAYFFGLQPGITPEDKPLICRCYHDSNIEFKNPSWNYDCDLISYSNNIKMSNNCRVYPNPFDNQLNIQMMESNGAIEIYDIRGLKIWGSGHHNGMVNINTSELDKGCYFLRVITNQQVYSKKLLKK